MSDTPTDPSYRQAVVDLFGVLAYGELTAFSRLAADADLAPTLGARAELARMAVAEFAHYEQLHARLVELDAVPSEAMAPFAVAVDAFHERTAPSSWLEGLVKAYVGDGIARDFYREISAYLDPASRDLVVAVMSDAGQGEFLVAEVLRGIAESPKVAGRLALWGRRLVGEALSQAQQVAVERDALVALLVGGITGAGAARQGADLADLAAMFDRITAAHTQRMERLGLSA